MSEKRVFEARGEAGQVKVWDSADKRWGAVFDV